MAHARFPPVRRAGHSLRRQPPARGPGADAWLLADAAALPEASSPLGVLALAALLDVLPAPAAAESGR